MKYESKRRAGSAMSFINSETTDKELAEIKQRELIDKSSFEKGVKAVMATKEARRYMLTLLKECNVFGSVFTGNSRTFFLEGRRDIGLKVYKQIKEVCKEEFELMVKEGKEAGVELW